VSRQDEQEINIHASAEAIWRALTDAEELKRWLVESAHVEPTVGGVYRLVFGDGLETDSRIATWQPGERLRLVSQMPTPTAEPVVEEYTLEKGEGAIVLRVVTSGIPDSPDWDGFVEGTRKGRVLAFSRCAIIWSITSGRTATCQSWRSTRHCLRRPSGHG
jgi:uncharacterized protein YndB with AHSA1/START domain